MATYGDKNGKRKNPKSTGASSGSNAGYTHRFIQRELGTDEKAEFRSLLAAGEFADVSVDDFLKVGYSIKFTAQNGGKTVLCSVSCSVEGDPNNGCILQGRAGDATTALAVVAYKDARLADNGVWATMEGSDSDTSDIS